MTNSLQKDPFEHSPIQPDAKGPGFDRANVHDLAKRSERRPKLFREELSGAISGITEGGSGCFAER
jgi:hypothetical protein